MVVSPMAIRVLVGGGRCGDSGSGRGSTVARFGPRGTHMRACADDRCPPGGRRLPRRSAQRPFFAAAARQPNAGDFFDVQAHSLLDLRWDVPRSSLFVEGFLVHGKVYEYFGPLPALLRLPVAAVTDSLDARLGQISMLLAFAVALTFTIRLASRLRPMVRGSAPVTRGEHWALGAFTFVVGAGSVLVVLAGRAWAYHEAELWGVALALGAFEYVIAFTLRPSRKHVVLASALTSAAPAGRASVGLGPLAALGLLLLASLWPRGRRLTGMVDDPTTRSRMLHS